MLTQERGLGWAAARVLHEACPCEHEGSKDAGLERLCRDWGRSLDRQWRQWSQQVLGRPAWVALFRCPGLTPRVRPVPWVPSPLPAQATTQRQLLQLRTSPAAAPARRVPECQGQSPGRQAGVLRLGPHGPEAALCPSFGFGLLALGPWEGLQSNVSFMGETSGQQLGTTRRNPGLGRDKGADGGPAENSAWLRGPKPRFHRGTHTR